MNTKRAGVPIVVSAPSGGGKTTMCHRVIRRLTGIEFSISYTTRPPRPGESHGSDYYFTDRAQFEKLIDAGAFLEWAHVHGHLYGTALAETETLLKRGIDVLFDIDVQGGQQILHRLPDAVLVFVVPPNMATLETRLRGRGNNTDADIARRLEAAAEEIRGAPFYTHWIINDHLEQAVDDLEAIVRSERLRRVDKEDLMRTVLGVG